VINDVDVDSYLCSVVSKEMLPGWHEESYKAQAIVARTYAIYEKQTAGADRYWDVFPDTRSQVYGGIPGETAKSRKAVNETAGIVVAAPDANGYPRIFKAYFSSCCGGISQSAADAFGETYIPPLTDQDVHAACRASPRFSWGPIVINKTELTQRFINYGKRRDNPLKNMGPLARIEVQSTNRWGRPIRFLITDTKNNKYSLAGEDFRWAVNFGAPEGSNTTLWSSFVKVISDSDQIRFVDGHGWGHGAGMCQWCAEKRAEDGLRHEDIVLTAFPSATLVRAY
jgi:stage II sporulation protein D